MCEIGRAASSVPKLAIVLDQLTTLSPSLLSTEGRNVKILIDNVSSIVNVSPAAVWRGVPSHLHHMYTLIDYHCIIGSIVRCRDVFNIALSRETKLPRTALLLHSINILHTWHMAMMTG